MHFMLQNGEAVTALKSVSKKYKPTRTQDGSMTLFSEQYQEHYHSLSDGALHESLQKHVIPAWKYLDYTSLESVTVLDICFGLGYNTLATLCHLDRLGNDKPVTIFAPELDSALIESLSSIDYPEELAPYTFILDALAHNNVATCNQVTIHLLIGDAREHVRNLHNTVHIVYQDPFSPKKNPKLWTREYFCDVESRMHADAILTTYSVATAVRLGMAECGLYVYVYEAEGARKGTIASKKSLPLEKVDLEHKRRINPDVHPLHDAMFF